MANTEHLAVLRAGVGVWNNWRREHPELRPDLSGVDLASTDLTGSDLRGADLSAAHLQQSVLRGADLRAGPATDLASCMLTGADLRGADLTGAKFQHTKLRDALLSGANFMAADMLFVDMKGVDLGGTALTDAVFKFVSFSNSNLAGATLGYSTFVSCWLSEVKGLNEMVHIGPCSLDYQTLRGAPHLPVGFLRGCGLPERWIDYLPLLCEDPIGLYSCFISYSSTDLQIAERLHKDLQERGVRCWFAPRDLVAGDKLLDTIQTAIRLRDKLLLIMSKDSIASGWVEDEVTRAFAEERSRGAAILVPVTLDDAFMRTDRAWAVKLRDSRYIQDFTSWADPEAYRQSIERLVGAFRSDASTART